MRTPTRAGVAAWLASATAVFATAALATVVFATPSPAHAATPPTTTEISCHIFCDGVDPQGAGLEDANGGFVPCSRSARTVFTAGGNGTGTSTVELRYSGKCRIAWARGGPHAIRVEGFRANGTLRSVHPHEEGSVSYTLAVDDAGLTARACSWVPVGGWLCTPRF
jgi:hypothetical protein